MKLLIQLTFNKGLGNLYCNIVELIDFVTFYKKIGYECHLIFSSNGDYLKNKYINFIKIEDIFDMYHFSMFDTIRNFENSITSTEFEDFTYHSTQYGADYPGIHSWDVFFNKPIDFLPYNKKRSSMETLFNKNFVPKIIPKFNKKIEERSLNFINKNYDIKKSIHIRYCDYKTSTDDYLKTILSDLINILKKTNIKFHFLSNNQFILGEITKLPNIIKYPFKNLDLFTNDHPYFHYHKKVDNNLLLERLYDNLAEMITLSHYDTIYFSTLVGPWTSTFLYYSSVSNPNQELINITNNLEAINTLNSDKKNIV